MTDEREQGSGGTAADPGRAAELLEEILRRIGDGELTASSPERAYLAGAATALRGMGTPAS